MLVLGVETSSPRGSLALAEISTSVNLLAEKLWLRDKSHSEWVTSTAQDLILSAGKQMNDLGAVVVGIGPGSFTGVRVGICFAKTLAYSLGLPMWQCDSLAVWARPLWQAPLPILVGVHGFRDLIYTTLISAPGANGRTVLRTSQALTLDQFIKDFPQQELAFAGDAWARFSDQWPAPLRDSVKITSCEPPLAKFLFEDLVQSSARREGTSWQNVKPLYIRGSEAEEKLRQGLLKPLPSI